MGKEKLRKEGFHLRIPVDTIDGYKKRAGLMGFRTANELMVHVLDKFIEEHPLNKILEDIENDEA